MSNEAKLSCVILAGGELYRETGLPRGLLPLRGVPLLGHILQLTEALRPRSTIIVAGEGSDAIAAWAGARAAVIRQRESLGSGHALGLALEALGGGDEDVFIVYADRVFLKPETVRGLLESRRTDAVGGLLSVHLEQQAGYARLVRDESGALLRVTGDCELVRPGDFNVREVVAGAYWFRKRQLLNALIPPSQLDRKCNLTECIKPLMDQGGKIQVHRLENAAEARVVATREDTRAIEAEAR